jgi:hypothetical protein
MIEIEIWLRFKMKTSIEVEFSVSAEQNIPRSHSKKPRRTNSALLLAKTKLKLLWKPSFWCSLELSSDIRSAAMRLSRESGKMLA